MVRPSKLLSVTCLVCGHCPIVSVSCGTVWGIIGNTVSVNTIHLINTLWSSQVNYLHIFATFPVTTGPLQSNIWSASGFFYGNWLCLFIYNVSVNSVDCGSYVCMCLFKQGVITPWFKELVCCACHAWLIDQWNTPRGISLHRSYGRKAFNFNAMNMMETIFAH